MKCPQCDGTGEVPDEEVITEPIEILIGTLTRKFGINDYETAEVGHSIYDDGSRYVLYLKSKGSAPDNRVPFYKETLKPWINFYSQKTP